MYEACGLEVQNQVDYTATFHAFNTVELARLENESAAQFLRDYSQEEFDASVNRWRTKVALSRPGTDCLAYLCGCATRPALRIYCAVTCELFHAGHVRLFQRVKERFPFAHFTVGVCSDEDVASYKRVPITTLTERVVPIEACRFVDSVIKGAPAITTNAFMLHNLFDLIVSGDDYSEEQRANYYPDVPLEKQVTFPYTYGISSSRIICEAREHVH